MAWGALMDSLGTALVDSLRVPERWGLVKASLSAVNGPLPSVAARTHLNSLKKVERLHRHVLLVDSEFRWRICLGKNWLGNSQTSSPLQPFPTPLPRPSTIIDLLKCQNQRSGDRKQPEELVSTTGVCCWQLILGRTFGSLPAILLFTTKGERLPVSAGSMQSKMFSSLGFGCVCYTSRTLESEKEMLSFSQTSSVGSTSEGRLGGAAEEPRPFPASGDGSLCAFAWWASGEPSLEECSMENYFSGWDSKGYLVRA